MNNYLASNLKYLRKSNNKSLKDVSTNIGKSIQAVQFWEAGSREPNTLDIIKLCNYYLVSADELLSKDLRFETNVELDESHKLDAIILEKSKELSEDDKKFIIDMIDKLKK